MRWQSVQRVRLLAVGLMVLSLVLALVGSAEAWRRRHHHGFSHSFGLYFYGAPYYGYPYYPYYGYPYYYRSPYSSHVYSPEEHRRFPTFQLPGFFHYPGALGKGEAAEQVLQPPAAGADPDQASGQETSGSPGR